MSHGLDLTNVRFSFDVVRVLLSWTGPATPKSRTHRTGPAAVVNWVRFFWLAGNP